MKIKLMCGLIVATRLAFADYSTNAVININAQVSGDPFANAGTPVRTNLAAGAYRLTVVSPAEDGRALFTDWFPFSNHALAEVTAYAIARDKAGGGRTTLYRWNGGAFDTLTNRTDYFTNELGGELLFGVGDQILNDNAGGVSVLVEFIAPIVSVTTAINVSFDAPIGLTFQLQGSPTLDAPNWSNIGGLNIGNGGSYSFCMPAIGNSNRFFRVQSQ